MTVAHETLTPTRNGETLAEVLRDPQAFDEFAWAVGIIEGEGWIGLVRPRPKRGIRNYARITVQTTDEDVMRRLARAMDCGILRGPVAPVGSRRQQTWIWDLAGAPAAELLRKLYPHLGSRRQKRIRHVLANIGPHRIDGQLELVE